MLRAASLSATVMTVILGTATVLHGVGAQGPDVSGTWVLDRERSRIAAPVGLDGLGASGAPDHLYVTHAANGTVILSSDVNGAQPRVYRVGGQSTVPAGADDSLLVTTRVEDGRLVTEARRSSPSGEAAPAVHEVMWVDAEGGTLTLEVTSEDARGEHTNVLVFRRATVGG